MHKIRTYGAITREAASALVESAVAEGAKSGVPVSVTIVDPSMSLVAFAKADGATPHSIDSSRRKANTAASTRKATGWMREDLALPLPLATDLRLTNIPGGHPLVYDGAVAGGIGIAGGTPAQDAEIAATVATSFSNAPVEA